MQKATVNGYLKTSATITPGNPLHTQLSLILTDFNPNANDQGIPLNEKDNIIRSALYSPLKINFAEEGYEGHDQAIAIGPITKVYDGKDGDRDVIYGDAVIWDEYHDEISTHLKEIFAEGIGTSWEIYYTDSEIDDNGIEWIHGCVFAGTCIVSTPAYGPTRTRVLAIAEKLRETNKLAKEDVSVSAETETVAETVDDTRTDLYNAEEILMNLWDGIYGLHNKLYEIEAEKNVTDIASIAAKFSDLIASITTKIGDLQSSSAEVQTERDKLQAELAAIKDQQMQAEKTNKQNHLRASLHEVGVDFEDEQWTQRVTIYESMTEQAFETYINDLQAVRTNATKAEQKVIKLPEPFTNGMTKSITVKEIASNWKKISNKE
jgi:hypothetical protein